jgi:HlyD family secretion protein
MRMLGPCVDAQVGHQLAFQVRLGVAAVNVIEVREGLNEGDRVILSDMSTWEGYDRVRLN